MRRKQNISISLFAFQDIITATTGIMILFVLALALMMNEVRKASSSQTHEQTNLTLESEAGQLRNQIEEFESRVVILKQSIGKKGMTRSDYQSLRQRHLDQLEERRHQAEKILEQQASIDREAEMLQQLLDTDDRSLKELEEDVTKRQKQLTSVSEAAIREGHRANVTQLLAQIKQVKESVDDQQGEPNQISYDFAGEDDSDVTVVTLHPNKAFIHSPTGKTRTLKGDPGQIHQGIFRFINTNVRNNRGRVFVALTPDASESFTEFKRLIERTDIRWGYDLLGSNGLIVK